MPAAVGVRAPRRSTALVARRRPARLRRALVALAREDAWPPGRCSSACCPPRARCSRPSLSYDLTVRGVGTFAVSIEDGSARVVRLLAQARPRGEALFHLAGEPLVLAELLAGERDKVGRFRRRARLTGRRKRVQELLALPEARLSLAAGGHGRARGSSRRSSTGRSRSRSTRNGPAGTLHGRAARSSSSRRRRGTSRPATGAAAGRRAHREPGPTRR